MQRSNGKMYQWSGDPPAYDTAVGSSSGGRYAQDPVEMLENMRREVNPHAQIYRQPSSTASERNQPKIAKLKRFGPKPIKIKCIYCKHKGLTSTHHVVGALSWILGTVTFLLGGVLGCCLIPCYLDVTRDVRHDCAECGRTLGLYKRTNKSRT